MHVYLLNQILRFIGLSDLVFLVWSGMHLCAVDFLLYLSVEHGSSPLLRGCPMRRGHFPSILLVACVTNYNFDQATLYQVIRHHPMGVVMSCMGIVDYASIERNRMQTVTILG